MLPSLRLPAAGMGEQLGSLALASGAVPREVAELDIALDAIKVWFCRSHANPPNPSGPEHVQTAPIQSKFHDMKMA